MAFRYLGHLFFCRTLLSCSEQLWTPVMACLGSGKKIRRPLPLPCWKECLRSGAVSFIDREPYQRSLACFVSTHSQKKQRTAGSYRHNCTCCRCGDQHLAQGKQAIWEAAPSAQNIVFYTAAAKLLPRPKTLCPTSVPLTNPDPDSHRQLSPAWLLQAAAGALPPRKQAFHSPQQYSEQLHGLFCKLRLHLL